MVASVLTRLAEEWWKNWPVVLSEPDPGSAENNGWEEAISTPDTDTRLRLFELKYPLAANHNEEAATRVHNELKCGEIRLRRSVHDRQRCM